MNHDKCGVAVFGPTSVADAFVIRVPASADDLYHCGPVGIRGFEHVHGKGYAVVFGVNDVADALGFLSLGGDGGN